MVGCDVEFLANTSAQDINARSVLEDLQPTARVQEAPVDQDRRAQPCPVLFPVLANRWRPKSDPVRRVGRLRLEAVGVGHSRRHPTEVRGWHLLEPPRDFAQVDAAVVSTKAG